MLLSFQRNLAKISDFVSKDPCVKGTFIKDRKSPLNIVKTFIASSSYHAAHCAMLQALLFWVSGVATILTSSLGVVGNLLSLAVLSKKVSDKTTYSSEGGVKRDRT